MMKQTLSTFVFFVLAATLCCAPAAKAQNTQPAAPAPSDNASHWSYSGKGEPANWGRLDKSYATCSLGREQSPINIRGARFDKALKPIEFHYMSFQAELINDGHTVQVNVPPGSYILVNGHRYELLQYHFHHPSEEAVKGRLSDMDVHLVHKDAEGKLAVIAIRLNEGSANAVLAALWEAVPITPGETKKTNDYINPAGLLPADRNYWTYEGSLTTPPCTEGVRWFVMQQEVEIGRTQLRSFGALYPRNVRPIQTPQQHKITSSNF
jgi:carbonic anhydrase